MAFRILQLGKRLQFIAKDFNQGTMIAFQEKFENNGYYMVYKVSNPLSHFLDDLRSEDGTFKCEFENGSRIKVAMRTTTNPEDGRLEYFFYFVLYADKIRLVNFYIKISKRQRDRFLKAVPHNKGENENGKL